MNLFVNDPIVRGDIISASYIFNGTKYIHDFIAPATINVTDPTAQRLARWVALIHSLYLFNVEYFTILEAGFCLDQEEIAFFEKLIFNGMAEFRVENYIPINTKTVVFSHQTTNLKTNMPEINHKSEGRLLLNGGGKDGIVSNILLTKSGLNFDFFQVGTSKAQANVARHFSKKPVIFRRLMDERRKDGRFSGHRPTSAAIAITAILSAYLLGKFDVIASNETSSNEPNLTIEGVKVNHQYSKSFEFEKDLSELLSVYGIPVRYFSILRPIHEIQIAKILVKYPEYSSIFISCNHGFRKGFWCMKCPKCAFITLILNSVSPKFADKTLGEDCINTPKLKKHIVSLINHEEDKPFECVGTLEECKIAAKLILEGKQIKIDADLYNLFLKHTSDIKQDQIEDILNGFDNKHCIPSPDYDDIIEQLKTIS